MRSSSRSRHPALALRCPSTRTQHRQLLVQSRRQRCLFSRVTPQRAQRDSQRQLNPVLTTLAAPPALHCQWRSWIPRAPTPLPAHAVRCLFLALALADVLLFSCPVLSDLPWSSGPLYSARGRARSAYSGSQIRWHCQPTSVNATPTTTLLSNAHVCNVDGGH